MWSLKSSQPGFLRTLILVYNLMVTRRVTAVKHTACVAISNGAFEGVLTNLDANPEGNRHGGYTSFPHDGSLCLLSSSNKIMLAAHVQAFQDHMAGTPCIQYKTNKKQVNKDQRVFVSIKRARSFMNSRNKTLIMCHILVGKMHTLGRLHLDIHKA